MAAGVAGLAQADVESCIVEARARGLMPSYHFSSAALDTALWRAQCYVQRYRAGCFMMILPGTHEVGDFFEMAVSFDFFVHHASCRASRNARGRALGQVDALLVDCPWSVLGFLKRAASLRGDAAQNLVKFGHLSTIAGGSRVCCRSYCRDHGRRSRRGLCFLRRGCCHGGDRGARDRAGPCDLPASGSHSRLSESTAIISSLARSAVPKAGGINAQVMERLRDLAGAGPARLAGHERRGQHLVDPCKTVQQEKELEAADGDELDLLTAEAFSDPIQKLMYFQMKQSIAATSAQARCRRRRARTAQDQAQPIQTHHHKLQAVSELEPPTFGRQLLAGRPMPSRRRTRQCFASLF